MRNFLKGQKLFVFFFFLYFPKKTFHLSFFGEILFMKIQTAINERIGKLAELDEVNHFSCLKPNVLLIYLEP